MKRLLQLILLLSLPLFLPAQGWQPGMKGIHPNPHGLSGVPFEVKFKTNGPLNKDWIYGGFFDPDSLRRCAAYREGGRWVSLPFSGYHGNTATDIELYGDTLYISGSFRDVILDKDSSTLPNTGLLKWYGDSIWSAPLTIAGVLDMSAKGDSMLFWGGSYYNPPQIVYEHFMTANGGKTWQYPYSVVHPTETVAYFGASTRLEILPNGDILTLNNASPMGNPYRGLSRWDGQQWHAYGNGLHGSGFVNALDFDFYRGELYMGGTFAKVNTFQGDTLYLAPLNPGNGIARWDGSQWRELSTGVLDAGVSDIIVHNDVLYCCTFSGSSAHHRFGDAYIPYFAGWNGQQWCGTPFNFGNPPVSFGFVNDTLFVSFFDPTTIDGVPVSYLNYYTGDFLNGPRAICSTPGLGESELPLGTEKLQLYPNPAQEYFTLTLPGAVIPEHFGLYHADGRLLRSGVLQEGENRLDIRELPPGIYLLKVNGRYYSRLVKQ